MTATRYKLTLSPSTDNDPPTNPEWTVDDILPINAPVVTAPQLVWVWDFLSAAQIADVIARTNLLDCTAAIQQAIDYVAGFGGARPNGTLYFPAGSYRIEDTLLVGDPITLVGAGEGSPNYPNTPPATQLAWYGTAKTMLIFGANGDQPFSGGGGWGFALDGRQIATECLRVRDAIRFWFRSIAPVNATERVVALVNSRAQVYPTGYGMFSDMWVSTGLTGSNAANALWVGSDSPTLPRNVTDGVALITFISCNFQSDQGASVLITDRGDNFTWLHCTTGHQGGQTVPGTWFSGNTAGAYENTVISSHTWINHTGDFRFDKGMGVGQKIVNLNYFDVSDPAFADPTGMLSGAGATEVSVDGNIGYSSGQNKTLGYRQTIKHDSMNYMDWDTGKNLLYTADGIWKTEVSASGTVADGAQYGGAILLTTDTSVNDSCAIYNTFALGNGGGGLNTFFYPNAVFSVSPISNTDCIIRCGWMDSITDPPTNGIYIEADTSQAWQGWRYVCKDGTGSTAVDGKYPFNTGDLVYMTRIELSNNPVPAANFFMRAGIFQTWGGGQTTANESGVTITTHVPSVITEMSFVFQIIAKGAAAKSIYISDFKRGFDTEGTTD